MRSMVIVSVALSFGVGVRATATRGEDPIPFSQYELALALPALESRASVPPSGNRKGEWTGNLGAASVRLRFHVLATADYDFFEPEDVVEVWRNSIRDPDDEEGEAQDFDFTFEPTRCVDGMVGATPILACARATARKKRGAESEGTLLLFGGLLPEHGWSLRADVWPALDAEATAALVASLERCVTYEGPVRDPRWSDAELQALWKELVPEAMLEKLQKPIRTAHYVVLTNSASPGPLVKKLEGWHARIAKVLPADELEGRRLLPLLLFRTGAAFEAFYRHHEELDARDEVGEESLATDHWVATACDVDDEEELLLDLTKQVLIVRSRAWGGCMWLRSGLREYLATNPSDRAEGVRALRKGKGTALERLLDDEEWEFQDREVDRKGTSEEVDYWTQSALWMEFLHTGPWPADSFPRFVRAAGCVRKGDGAGVAAVLRSIYGLELTELDAKRAEALPKR